LNASEDESSDFHGTWKTQTPTGRTVHSHRQTGHRPGHPFYSKVNEVLAEAGFDDFAERLCAKYYKDGGRPGIPPGIYFRMLFVGYFEGLDSQRGIAGGVRTVWDCGAFWASRSPRPLRCMLP